MVKNDMIKTIGKRIGLALLATLVIGLVINWRLLWTLIKLELQPNQVTATSVETTVDTSSDYLRIPTLGLKAPLVVSSVDPTNVADWSIIKKDLTQGVSLSTKLSLPGQSGTTVITGHSSDWWPHPYSAVFAGLNRLEPGDLVQVVYNGRLHRYQIREKQIVEPTSELFSQNSLQQPTDKNRLFLVTCWPLLTTQQRLVVIAELVN